MYRLIVLIMEIISSCSLIAFARANGKMQLGSFKNQAGENFKSCIFTDNEGNKQFVGFSSHLGELSASEIVAMKDQLQVVTLDSGSHILCKQGQNTWEDIDLGI